MIPNEIIVFRNTKKMVSITYLYLDVSIADTQLILGIIFFWNKSTKCCASIFLYLFNYVLRRPLSDLTKITQTFGWFDENHPDLGDVTKITRVLCRSRQFFRSIFAAFSGWSGPEKNEKWPQNQSPDGFWPTAEAKKRL